VHKATAAYSAQLEALRAVYAADLPEKGRAIVAAAGIAAEGWDPGDLDSLYRLAHRLAGSAAIYGFPGVTRTASALEDFLASGTAEGGTPAERARRLRALAAALAQACDDGSEPGTHPAADARSLTAPGRSARSRG
jgi:HPt (histidine-containing phosphotransfer) domain-containing protein